MIKLKSLIKRPLNEGWNDHIKMIEVSYIDRSKKFYGMYLNMDNGKRVKVSSFTEAAETLEALGVKTPLPQRYADSILDKIGKELKSVAGIGFEADDAMDVS